MEFLLFEQKGPLGILQINRFKALNALNKALLEELFTFFKEKKNSQLKVVIITGTGNKAFCAGADLKEMQAMSHKEILNFTHLGHQVTSLIEKSPFVTIAAINGFALGGGLEIALGCDFIYASQTAQLGLPEVSLGLIPGFGGTQRLSRSIGTRRANEMIFTGEIISAETAQNIGLINKTFSQETLIENTTNTALKISNNSFFAIQQAKIAINNGYQIPINEACILEQQMFSVTFSSNNREEGINAFIEKRTPQFT
jgi:enoyl-CoA hydratase